MEEGYSLKMLAAEFWALKRNDWDLYPNFGFERMLDGTIRHGLMTNGAGFHDAFETDLITDPPVRILEEGARGAAINSQWDQSRLLQYWAW
jgi:hypothetical protein